VTRTVIHVLLFFVATVMMTAKPFVRTSPRLAATCLMDLLQAGRHLGRVPVQVWLGGLGGGAAAAADTGAQLILGEDEAVDVWHVLG
jgi:hypothetical protein